MSLKTTISEIVRQDLTIVGKTLPGEANCNDIQIRGDCLILNFDNVYFKNNIINNIFNSGQSRSVCDYIIVSDRVILVCELKSENLSGATKQLKASQKFVRYLIDMAKIINRQIVEPPIKYVCFSSKNIGKQKTSSNKLDSNPWEGSELFHLSCNSIYSLSQFC